MFSRVVARGIAAASVFLLALCGGPLTAAAQMQGIPVATDPAPDRAAAVQPFGLAAVVVAGGEIVTKWNGVEAEIDAERAVLERCRDDGQTCPEAARKFLAVIAEGRGHVGRARIGLVNRAINMAVRPTSDLAQWGVPDHWSAPLETFASGRGDCEDYAIAKYVALLAAGVAEDDLRLVIVRDLAVGEDHAVVVVRLDGSWIVLDNRRLILVEDTELRQVVPLFVLDHGGVKQFAPMAIAADEGVAAAPGALGFF